MSDSVHSEPAPNLRVGGVDLTEAAVLAAAVTKAMRWRPTHVSEEDLRWRVERMIRDVAPILIAHGQNRATEVLTARHAATPDPAPDPTVGQLSDAIQTHLATRWHEDKCDCGGWPRECASDLWATRPRTWDTMAVLSAIRELGYVVLTSGELDAKLARYEQWGREQAARGTASTPASGSSADALLSEYSRGVEAGWDRAVREAVDLILIEIPEQRGTSWDSLSHAAEIVRGLRSSPATPTPAGGEAVRRLIHDALCSGADEQYDVHVTHDDQVERVVSALIGAGYLPAPPAEEPAPAAPWRCVTCGSSDWVGWRAGPEYEGYVVQRASCVPCGQLQALPAEHTFSFAELLDDPTLAEGPAVLTYQGLHGHGWRCTRPHKVGGPHTRVSYASQDAARMGLAGHNAEHHATHAPAVGPAPAGGIVPQVTLLIGEREPEVGKRKRRHAPPPPPDEPAAGRSCDAGRCDGASIGWRWFGDLKQWLPCCAKCICGKGVPPEHRAYDDAPAPTSGEGGQS